MDSLLVIFFSIFIFFVAYRFYGKFLDRLFGINPENPTPAHKKFDGADYVPAKHWLVLFGHHFASIAGAGPVIGPIIAVWLWGWGPALAWVILGTIFIGGVHDFGSIIASVRQDGHSIAEVAEDIISRKARLVFSAFVWLALILIVAVFVYFCAKTFAVEPKIILPSLGLVAIALVAGFLLYSLKWNLIPITIFGLVSLVALIILGQFLPVDLGKNGLFIWSLLLLVYCFVASVLPVQILLQPRDYLSSYLLFFAVIVGFLGLLISRPKINSPAFISWHSQEGWLWPMLFVTVACGAISGFHSLVGSGTTSKQIANEAHSRKIGYGGMVMEGLVAVMVILAITAGLSNYGELNLFLTKGGGGPISAFGRGYGAVTKNLLGGYGALIAITILNAFILTTLDTCTRIGRYITQELFGIKNRFIATFIVVLLGGMLALSGQWNRIWPMFGAANQLVGALALVVITTWLLSHKKKVKFTLLPAIFMLITTTGALIFQLINSLKNRHYLLVIIATSLIALALYMIWEVYAYVKRTKRKCAG